MLTMLEGKWIGWYAFANPRVRQMMGFERTGFEIDITKTTRTEFEGTVQDDPNSGGMEGIGTIHGTISGDGITFVKQMPTMTLLVDSTGRRRNLNRKHPPVYYQGKLSRDGNSIEGTWRFKFGIAWLGILPVLVLPTKGTWAMKRQA